MTFLLTEHACSSRNVLWGRVLSCRLHFQSASKETCLKRLWISFWLTLDGEWHSQETCSKFILRIVIFALAIRIICSSYNYSVQPCTNFLFTTQCGHTSKGCGYTYSWVILISPIKDRIICSIFSAYRALISCLTTHCGHTSKGCGTMKFPVCTVR